MNSADPIALATARTGVARGIGCVSPRAGLTLRTWLTPGSWRDALALISLCAALRTGCSTTRTLSIGPIPVGIPPEIPPEIPLLSHSHFRVNPTGSHSIPLAFFYHAPTAPSARGTGNRAQVAGRQWNSSLPESSAREMKPNQGSSSQIKAAFFPLPPANHPNRLAIGEAAFYRHPLPFARTGPPHGFAAHFLNHTS